jgi:hypothetical protein
MQRRLRFLLVLGAFFLAGCSGGFKLALDGEKAAVNLPAEPVKTSKELPVKIFQGDPKSTAPPPVEVVYQGQKKPKPLWKETPFTVEVTHYRVTEDPRYPWGASVFKFSNQATEQLGDETLEFVRTQFIPPGHYGLIEEKKTKTDGLETVYASAKQARGESRVEVRMIVKGDVVYAVGFEANLSNYPQERATRVLDSLVVKP